VAEIRELHDRIAMRDTQIERLHEDVTDRLKHVQTLYDENQALRLKAGISPDEVIDLKDLRIAQYVELETLRAEKQVGGCCFARVESVFDFCSIGAARAERDAGGAAGSHAARACGLRQASRCAAITPRSLARS
jgi:hypothetical protein